MAPRGPPRTEKPARQAPVLPPVGRRHSRLRGGPEHLRLPAAPQRLVPVRGSRLRPRTICPQGLVSSCLPPRKGHRLRRGPSYLHNRSGARHVRLATPLGRPLIFAPHLFPANHIPALRFHATTRGVRGT